MTETIEDIVTYCPNCGTLHLDTGEWCDRPHKKHLCLHCSTIFGRLKTFQQPSRGVVEASIWEDLTSALAGKNGYGGSVAEIYAYRLVSDGTAKANVPGFAEIAARNLTLILREFKAQHPEALIGFKGRVMGEWKFLELDLDKWIEPFDWRIHIEVRPNTAALLDAPPLLTKEQSTKILHEMQAGEEETPVELAHAALADDTQATKGPWGHERETRTDPASSYRFIYAGMPPDGGGGIGTTVAQWVVGNNAAFIAAARTREPTLAREVLRLTDDNADLEGALKKANDLHADVVDQLREAKRLLDIYERSRPKASVATRPTTTRRSGARSAPCSRISLVHQRMYARPHARRHICGVSPTE